MLRQVVLAAVATTLPLAAAVAEDNKFNITPLEKAACATDAIRLCSQTYPDEDKLLDCMRGNVRSLSLVCSATFRAGLKRRHIPL